MVDLGKLKALEQQASAAINRKRGGTAPRRPPRERKDHGDGPGAVLKERLAKWGISGCPSCLQAAQRMDKLGPDLCYAQRHDIAQEILPRAKSWLRDGRFRSFALKLIPNAAEDAGLLIVLVQLIEWSVDESRRRQKKRTIDVMQIVGAGVRHWGEDQNGFVGTLEEAGISAQTLALSDNDDLLAALHDRLPRVCLIRSMPIPSSVLRPMAVEWPHTQFVVLCQSLPSHLITWDGSLDKFTDLLELSAELPNVWLATPDGRVPWKVFTPRSAWIPNTAAPVAARPPQPIIGPIDLSLIGRRDVVKNFPNQILAAGIANRTRPVRLHLMVKGNSGDLKRLATGLCIETYAHPWRDHEEHRFRLSEMVDIGLQATYSESFNYVGLEHLLAGKPVVGSSAIRFLPQSMQVDPNDMDEISAMILALAGQIDSDPAGVLGKCQEIGSRVAAANRDALIAEMRRLLDAP